MQSQLLHRAALVRNAAVRIARGPCRCASTHAALLAHAHAVPGSARCRLGEKELVLETGRLGPLTDGMVFARWGDTSLIVSAVGAWESAQTHDMTPLSVDYREKAFAGGVIPGTYTRREASTSDRETLAARVVDRTLRPVCARGWVYDTHITVSVLSVDADADPVPLAVNAASAALQTSNIPWGAPVACVRVGWAADGPVVAPAMTSERSHALSLLFSGTRDKVVMMEAGAAELPERDMVLSMRAAAAACQPLLDLQAELVAAAGRTKKALPMVKVPAELLAAVYELIWEDARAMYQSHGFKKAERGNAQRLLFIKIKEQLRDRFPADQHKFFSQAGDIVMKKALRSLVFEAAERTGSLAAVHVDPLHGPSQHGVPPALHHLRKGDAALIERQVAVSEVVGTDVTVPNTDEASSASSGEEDAPPTAPEAGATTDAAAPSLTTALPYQPTYRLVDGVRCRPDGRSTTDIRALRSEVDVLPLVHGSSIFTRGDTQVLCTTTLGPLDLAQTLRPAALGGQVLKKNFFLHYDFPPYCTNEIGRAGGVNRRMIGHGALAERALVAVMPSEDAFPYTVRVTSEVSGSDGSSSMATVCGATLALLDAGVPLKAPVAGISIGSFCPPEADFAPGSLYALLTDIFGLEDHSGDMDFKVAGSRYGITALQLDVKPAGLPLEVLEQALWRARDARLRVLDSMAAVMPRHREEVKPSAPRVEQLVVPTEMFGKLVGPGGANVKRIQSATGAKVQLDASSPVVSVYATRDNLAAAKGMVTASLDEHRRITGSPLSVVSMPGAPVLQVGGRVKCVVSKMHEFGAVLSTPDGVHELGWMHISEFTPTRTAKATDVLDEGDSVEVMVVDVDARGRGKLSIRALLQPGEDYKQYITRKTGAYSSSQAVASETASQEAVKQAEAPPAPAAPAPPIRTPQDVSAEPAIPSPSQTEAAVTTKPSVVAASSSPAGHSSTGDIAPPAAEPATTPVDDPADIFAKQVFSAAMFAYLQPAAAAALHAHGLVLPVPARAAAPAPTPMRSARGPERTHHSRPRSESGQSQPQHAAKQQRHAQAARTQWKQRSGQRQAASQ